MVFYSKRVIIVRWADLSDFFVDFRRKNVYFCFTSNENCHFSSEKTITPQSGLLIFLWKETHYEKIMKSSRILTKEVTTTTVNLEIVEDFASESKFLHFPFFFIIFLHLFSFFIFLIFSFSFILFHFLTLLSCSFIFFHFHILCWVLKI